MRKAGKSGKVNAVLSVLLLLVVGFIAVYTAFFMPNNSMAPPFVGKGPHLVIDGRIVTEDHPPVISDEEIQLPFDTVKKYIDPTIYWDDALKKVTVTTKDRVIRMKTGSLDALVNNKPMTLKLPVTMKDGAVYLPIEFLSDFYQIDIRYVKDNDVIVIDWKYGVKQLAKPVSPGAVIRKRMSVRSPIVKKLGDSAMMQENGKDEGIGDTTDIRIFEEFEHWYRVRTYDGVVGYIEKRFVAVTRTLAEYGPSSDLPAAWKPSSGKLNLLWDALYSERADLSQLTGIHGVDVLSPTWFQVANDKGDLINRADAKYMAWAHKNGYRVWALFSNDFSDPFMTSRVLGNTDVRDNIIRQLLAFASLYKLDGINVDIENVNLQDKGALTQFIREAAPLLREQGLVVSMDVTVPDGSDNYSQCYDRKAIGGTVDYVILMAYDQHWASSPEAGSVAQIGWVEENVQKTAELVPHEKLVLGIPFYTRLWKETGSADGATRTESVKSLSMDDARKLVRDSGADVRWDETSGQFYCQYAQDGATYKLWLEDGNSVNIKSSLVRKYDLAGAAEWRRAFESSDIWAVLERNLKALDSYQDWKTANAGKVYTYK